MANLLKSFETDQSIPGAITENSEGINKKVVIILIIVGLFTGALSGVVLKTFSKGKVSSPLKPSLQSEKTSAGVKDSPEFPDSAEGILKEGGIDGEGNFHLERPGGPSQNVYLFSNTVDLSEFVGKKVMVQGKTYAAEKAGWLMEVGYIEVLK